MKFEEFLYDQSSSRGDVAPSQLARSEEPSSSPEPEEEIEIQKAVVESLAADKVKIEEEVVLARERSAALEREVKALKDELALMADRIARNEVTPDSSKVALLERNVELDDRFDGEIMVRVDDGTSARDVSVPRPYDRAPLLPFQIV